MIWLFGLWSAGRVTSVILVVIVPQFTGGIFQSVARVSDFQVASMGEVSYSSGAKDNFPNWPKLITNPTNKFVYSSIFWKPDRPAIPIDDAMAAPRSAHLHNQIWEAHSVNGYLNVAVDMIY